MMEFAKSPPLLVALISLFVQQCLSSPVWLPQFVSGGFGRNIRHLPCISKRTGEEGICMFAFTCMKANGTHLGTCIDRFYFGSCCKLDESSLSTLENDVFPPASSGSEPKPVTKPTPKPAKPTTESAKPSTTVTTTKRPSSITPEPLVVTDKTTPKPQTKPTAKPTAKPSTSKPSTTVTTAKPTRKPSTKPTTQAASTTARPSPTTTRPKPTTTRPKPTTTRPKPTTTRPKPTTTRPKPTTATQRPTKPATPRPTKPSPSTVVSNEIVPSSTHKPTAKPSNVSVAEEEEENLNTIVESQKPPRPTGTTSAPALSKPSHPDGPSDTTSTDKVPSKPQVSSSTQGSSPSVTPEEETEETSTESWVLIGISTSPDKVSTTPIPEEDEEGSGGEDTSSADPAATPKPTTAKPATTSPSAATNTTTPSDGKPQNTTAATGLVTTSTPDIDAPLNMSNFKDVCGRRLFPESRIVGGDKASFGKWPWQISLRQWRTSTYLHKCGAALLNENWAITAAHCVENVPPSDLLLRLGEHDLSSEEEPYGYQERRVQIVASHPQFDPRTFEYDLALLRFYEPVIFQPNIIPICIPEDDKHFIGETAYVTGWGRLYEDGPLPSVLQEVAVPVINNSACEAMYRSAGYIEHIPGIFICAGWKKGGFDSCEGDSGGPLVIQRDDRRWLLAGIISWGIGCAEPNQPGVYTRISEFRDWINQILQF